MAGGGVGRPPPAPLNWGSTTSCTQLTPHSADGLCQPEEGGPGPPGIQPGRTPVAVQGDGLGEDRPFAYAQRLLDMAHRWLRPELRSADEVVELVALERFIDGLPGETANWVRCHRPTGLAAAVTLAEDHLALYLRGQSQQQQQQQQGRADPAPRRRALPRSLPSPLSSSLPRAQTPAFSRNNPFFSVSPAPGSVATGYDPQRAPQTPGPGCWRCGQPGHLRRECPLMEVEQVVRVVGPPTSSPDPDGAYCIPDELPSPYPTVQVQDVTDWRSVLTRRVSAVVKVVGCRSAGLLVWMKASSLHFLPTSFTT
ncbi:uncharacterized protein LOC118237310 isoform X2 [Anguilla anguilla]|uniref:uncharacterized protein LOC118237310 isoform X2 n=1 Tax=Anguilla anguilla TaxID=7936 RepID=UPI0015A8DDCA|nr:uncharacterized protein LOC118237310 isoform X2 [Anguilla anguilla]